MENIKEYPIKAVSLKTGLSIHVIRAWEKRYKAVVPHRTDTNRRLYSDQDIEKLDLLSSCIANGHNIGSVAALDIEQLKELLPDNSIQNTYHQPSQSLNGNEDVGYFIEKCISAVKNFDVIQLEKSLYDASLQLTQPAFLELLIVPLITEIGDLWHGGKIRIMHEHLATATLKTFLANMRNSYRIPANAPNMIVTTPIGQTHELGALILSLVATSDGWNVTYLGPNLPADEIVMAVKEKKAKAVMLSIVYPADDHFLKKDLLKLRNTLSKGVSILVGGRLAESYKAELQAIKAIMVNDLAGFREISPTIMNL